MSILLKPSNKFFEESYSDYGSDLSSDEEYIIDCVLASIAGIDGSKGIFSAQKNYENDQKNSDSNLCPSVSPGKGADSFCYPIEDGVRALSRTPFKEFSKSDKNKSPKPLHESVDKPVTRSPLRRFRSRPRKGLTVTDLVTPAWCEMKYWYTLSRHGVQRQTIAMQQGTRVHEKLESEVHTFVPVKVHIKEDKLGLRIWNVIQGLRTLRECGRTRELQVWGLVDGEVVGGKIDELSYESHEVLNGQKEDSESDQLRNSTKNNHVLNSNINEGSSLEYPRKNFSSHTHKIFICDVKTRTVQRLPSETGFRPTKYQLMLYHRFITSLVSGQMDLHSLTTHYNIDPDRTFSDSFLAQVCSLDQSLLNTQLLNESLSTSDKDQCHDQEPLPILLANNNLSSLWDFMLSEFQKTFPRGADSLSNILKAEFRSNKIGNIIGTKTFLMNDADLTDYLNHGMQWWKGKRAPQGVPANEAYKCRSCDFADICEWRLEKAEEDRTNFILKRETLNLKSGKN